METKRAMQRIKEWKEFILLKDKQVWQTVNLIKTKREKTQINKIRDEKNNITSNTNEIQRIIREYFEFTNQVKNLEEMDKFLHVY
jgi:hypothetical protein